MTDLTIFRPIKVIAFSQLAKVLRAMEAGKANSAFNGAFSENYIQSAWY
jgi:hypothetical protein